MNETILWQAWVRTDHGKLPKVACCDSKRSTIWETPPVDFESIPRDRNSIVFVGMVQEAHMLLSENFVARTSEHARQQLEENPTEVKDGGYVLFMRTGYIDLVMVPPNETSMHYRYFGGIFRKYDLESVQLLPVTGVNFFWRLQLRSLQYLDDDSKDLRLPLCIVTTGMTDCCLDHTGQAASVFKRLEEIGKLTNTPVEKIPSFASLINREG